MNNLINIEVKKIAIKVNKNGCQCDLSHSSCDEFSEEKCNVFQIEGYENQEKTLFFPNDDYHPYDFPLWQNDERKVGVDVYTIVDN